MENKIENVAIKIEDAMEELWDVLGDIEAAKVDCDVEWQEDVINDETADSINLAMIELRSAISILNKLY